MNGPPQCQEEPGHEGHKHGNTLQQTQGSRSDGYLEGRSHYVHLVPLCTKDSIQKSDLHCSASVQQKCKKASWRDPRDHWGWQGNPKTCQVEP